MNLIRLRELESLDKLMNGFFNQSFNENSELFRADVDLYHQSNNLVVEIELPGVNPEKTEITVTEDRMLKIATSRNLPEDEQERKYFRKEIRKGEFEKYVALPNEQLDTEKITAIYKNGVLKLTIPKKENEVRKIKINLE